MHWFRVVVIPFALLVDHAFAGEAADVPQAPQTVEVVLSNFRFTPNVLRLRANMSYRLHIVNSASGGHSFSAPQFFATVSVAPQDRAKIANGRVEIPAGQAVDIAFTPMTAGTFPVTCTHFLHATFGMRGQAVVE